jgi:hypothetical protein
MMIYILFLFFFSLTMKYEKGIEPSSHCHLTFSSFSISSHLYSIQFILNDLMRSFRNGAIEHIEILFNHARDCDRVERNNRWKSSNYRQFVIVDDLWVLTHKRKKRDRQTKRIFSSTIVDILPLLLLLRLFFVISSRTSQ